VADLRPSPDESETQRPPVEGATPSPFGVRGTASADGRPVDSRAQLILVTGFVIAVVLIALALVMNSAIYTENLATRSDSSGATEAAAYQRAVESAALEAFEYAHAVNDSDYVGLNRNVTDAIAGIDAISTRQEAAYGHIPNLSVAATVNGTAISDDGGVFDSDSDADNWTVASDVSAVRAFNIHVDDRSDLNQSGDREFRVVVDPVSGGDRWTMNVTRDTSTNEVVVGVNATGSYDECRRSTVKPWINVTAGTVGGEPCDALTFAEGITGSYDVNFRNGTGIEGSYSLVVNDDVSVLYGVAGFGDPQDEPALYNMTVDMVYRTAELDYRTKIEIEPGDHDG